MRKGIFELFDEFVKSVVGQAVAKLGVKLIRRVVGDDDPLLHRQGVGGARTHHLAFGTIDEYFEPGQVFPGFVGYSLENRSDLIPLGRLRHPFGFPGSIQVDIAFSGSLQAPEHFFEAFFRDQLAYKVATPASAGGRWREKLRLGRVEQSDPAHWQRANVWLHRGDRHELVTHAPHQKAAVMLKPPGQKSRYILTNIVLVIGHDDADDVLAPLFEAGPGMGNEKVLRLFQQDHVMVFHQSIEINQGQDASQKGNEF